VSLTTNISVHYQHISFVSSQQRLSTKSTSCKHTMHVLKKRKKPNKFTAKHRYDSTSHEKKKKSLLIAFDAHHYFHNISSISQQKQLSHNISHEVSACIWHCSIKYEKFYTYRNIFYRNYFVFAQWSSYKIYLWLGRLPFVSSLAYLKNKKSILHTSIPKAGITI
jgi:hypothetical protein